MSDAPASLRHSDSKDDAALAEESRSHVANSPALQLIAELVTKLRTSRFSWWTPETIRSTWDSKTRMTWFAERPDIRQRITCSLTGLAPKASRNKAPDFQAALIDSVVDDGDVTSEQLENAFDPVEIAAYAPVNELWHKFKERMPWDQDTAAHQELVGWLLDQFLASSSTIEGMTRKPILTSHAVRTTIPGKIWHSKIPLEVRVAIDDLRFQRERAKPGEPFHAIHDLSVATPTIIATNIPLRELLRVIDVAEKAMGLDSRGSHAAPPPKPEETKAAEHPKEAAKPAAAVEAKAQPAVPPAAAAPEKSDKALADKVVAEKVVVADKAPKSAIERMADKVLEKVVAKDARDAAAASPKAETPKAPPASTALPGTPIGKPVHAAPQASAAAVPPPPAPGAALHAPPGGAGGEPITARGPKSETDVAPASENGEDIVVDTDDSFKFDDEDEGSGVGTKEDPRALSKKQEAPVPPAPPAPKR
jgi:hypothetical protein